MSFQYANVDSRHSSIVKFANISCLNLRCLPLYKLEMLVDRVAGCIQLDTLAFKHSHHFALVDTDLLLHTLRFQS